ncbi:DNA repair protein RecO [Sphingobacterium olei]|uniref:DNA repair protein RecO n=1 Tax=Sphingobacterium olei TaxID=2571155 RepID=A0A4U0P4U1_9SPHI|nr:DNA repair protein RecO [Sphingobacterium olei]TJZ62289.1 DNA repair protein RecO [Sphingobacterium olei]
MLQKTKGIALKVTNYSENSVVAQIFTEDLGLQSYLINGARKPKAKIHINMLQPLHLLEMVVYHKDNNALQRIKEAQQYPALHQIPLNIVKSSLAIFLNEVLYKVLKHQQPDPQLFHFIQQSILWLDETESPLANFHLSFLMKLSKFLGFLPTVNQDQKPFFDLMDGVFTDSLPPHQHVLQEPHTTIFHNILTSSYEASYGFHMKHVDRIYLLQKIIDFYRLHTENFGEVNSLYILEEIFH